MEAGFEKFKQNEISDPNEEKDLEMAQELELADRLGKDEDIIDTRGKTKQEKTEERFEKLFGLLKDYYLSTMDELDGLKTDISEGRVEISQEKFDEIFDLDLKKLEVLVDYSMPELLGRINFLIKNKGIELADGNSIFDIVQNSMLSAVNSIKDAAKKIKAGEINEIRESRKSIIKILGASLDVAAYYSNELCRDEGKLINELNSPKGYIEKFADYFQENDKSGKVLKFIPQGGKKLAYFRFFSELEKGKFEGEKIKEELDKLDSGFINKEKVLSDIESGEFWKKYPNQQTKNDFAEAA